MTDKRTLPSLGEKLAARIARGRDLAPAKTWPLYGGGYLDRSETVSASEVEQCLRRLKFKKQTGDLPFPNWGYAERGHLIEDWVVKCLRATGMELLYAGEDQVSFRYGVQSGTPDGATPYKDGLLVLEFKSVDPRTNFSKLPKLEHLSQVQQNMDLMAFILGPEVPIYGALIIYIDASNLQRTHETIVLPDAQAQERLERRAHKVMEASSPADLPTEGMLTGDCDRCEFVAQCNDLQVGSTTQLGGLNSGFFK